MKKILLLPFIVISLYSCSKPDINDVIDSVVIDNTTNNTNNQTPPPFIPQTIYPTSIQNHQWNMGWYTAIRDFVDNGGTSKVQLGTSYSYLDWDFDGDIDIFVFPEAIINENNQSEGNWPNPVILQNDGLTNNNRIQWRMIQNVVTTQSNGIGYRKLASGDVDNDGDLDLVGFIAEDPSPENGNLVKGGLHLFRFNSETKKFDREDIWPYGAEKALSFFHGGTMGDVNNDGYIDIITGGIGPKVFLNNNGSFTKDYFEPTRYSSGGYDNADIYSIEIIDINNDGLQDLLLGASKKPWNQFYSLWYTRQDFGRPSEIHLNTGEYPYYNDEPDFILEADEDYSHLSDDEWFQNTFGVNYDWQVIDFDRDGDLDIFTLLFRDSDGFGKIAYHENTGNSFLPKTSEIFDEGQDVWNNARYGNQGGLCWIKVWDIDDNGDVEILFENETPGGKNAWKQYNGKFRKTTMSNIYNTN